MRRTVAILLVLALTFTLALVGCDSNSTTIETGRASTEPSSEESPTTPPQAAPRRLPSLAQGWTRVAEFEPWVEVVVDINALRGGGFVAGTLDPLGVVWSPDGATWYDAELPAQPAAGHSGHPPSGPVAFHHQILAVTNDDVAVLDSAHNRVWFGDPVSGVWEDVALDAAGSHQVPELLAVASNNTTTLVVGRIGGQGLGDGAAGSIAATYTAWVVNRADGTADRNPIPLDLTEPSSEPLGAALVWFDERWLLTTEDGGNTLLTSPDGAIWTRVEPDDYWDGSLTSWSTGADSVIATVCNFGGDGFWYSTDGLHWTETTTRFVGHHSAYSDALGFIVMYATEYENTTAVSSNGRSWARAGAVQSGPTSVAEMAASDTHLLVYQPGQLWLWSAASP